MGDSDQSSQRLFRQEAIDAKLPRLAGEVVLQPGMSATVLALISLVISVGLVAFAYYGSYTRRATVTGYLLPEGGVTRVMAVQPGVVEEIKASDGLHVRKGDVLFVISTDRLGPDAADFQAQISRGIVERRRSLETELGQSRAAQRDESALLARRLENLKAEQENLVRQIEQQKARLSFAEDALARYRRLLEQDLISREQVVQKEVDAVDQRVRLQALQRDQIVVERELATTQRDLEATRARYETTHLTLQRSVSSTQQEYTELEARRRIIVTAAVDGVVTFVQTGKGALVDTQRPLAYIVPAGVPLEARLLAPGRAIGFVKPGREVKLRYQAYPYQKFGQQDGVVTAVSSFAAQASDLVGAATPEGLAGEPLYAITVRLKAQTLVAYGREEPLQAGMKLEADIMLDSRRLYEWMLEPLFSISGKM